MLNVDVFMGILLIIPLHWYQPDTNVPHIIFYIKLVVSIFLIVISGLFETLVIITGLFAVLVFIARLFVIGIFIAWLIAIGIILAWVLSVLMRGPVGREGVLCIGTSLAGVLSVLMRGSVGREGVLDKVGYTQVFQLQQLFHLRYLGLQHLQQLWNSYKTPSGKTGLNGVA